MAKKKKVNCKHGLNCSEEIQARKLRWQLEAGDEEYNQLIRELYEEWFMKPKESFYDWLWPQDKILSSALRRMYDWQLTVFGKSIK